MREVTTKQKQKAVGNRGTAKWVVLALAVVSTAYFVWSHASTPASPGSAMSNAGSGKAPTFTLPDIDNKQVSLSDFKGKVVVLDFWATWCPPCRKEIPDFINLQKEYGSKGVQFVGIGLDDAGKLRAFAQQYQMNYPVLVGTQDIAMKYGGIQGIPTTFIIDRSGTVVSKFEGYRPRQVFEDEIKKLLK